MLLAEIHGKSCPEVEGLEDLITSSVFGHLRLIDPPLFWQEFFGRARTVERPSRTLSEVLLSSGIEPRLYTKVETRFWSSFSNCQPDLVLRFTGDGAPPLVTLVEVKLNSGKSGFGGQDQLAKYLSLLDDAEYLKDWSPGVSNRFLLYLTRRFAEDDLENSVLESKSPNARGRMFGVEWADILEVSSPLRCRSSLLGEVADFLDRRRFGRFGGYRAIQIGPVPGGDFFRRGYFREPLDFVMQEGVGFYGH
jgi:hypothetical protein